MSLEKQSEIDYIKSLRAVCFHCEGEREDDPRGLRKCVKCGSTDPKFLEPKAYRKLESRRRTAQLLLEGTR